MTNLSQEFDEILRSHPAQTREAISFLNTEMARRDCRFGEEIVPSFLRPVFLEKQQVTVLSRTLGHIINILEKVTRLYFSHPHLREYFYLDPKAAKLIEVDHGYSRNIVISRPDAFINGDSLRFVEFNCDSPAGPGYADVQEDIVREGFPFNGHFAKYQILPPQRSRLLLDALLAAYAEFAGQGKCPNIAIMDWREVRTVNEFRILKTFFESQGLACVIADPRELVYREGRLYHKDFPIDLVYRRAIFRELMERYDEVGAFLRAYQDGKVCVVNPLRSRLASNKAVLSILTDQQRYKELFSDEENRVIQKHIPWTRRVKDIQTQYENNEIFLLSYINGHKDHLVLKPADSYGGKDVMIGRECPQGEWEGLAQHIIKNDQDWVVQRYVDITTVEVPVVTNGDVHWQTKKYNINPFVFSGRYAGSIARMSENSVINVSAGGGLVPVMAYCESPVV